MKNYYKKFSIMFVMLLAVIGIGAVENGSVANAATVGQQLLNVEDSSWQRIDDTDSNFSYDGGIVTNSNNGWVKYTDSDSNQSSLMYTTSLKKLSFEFKGSKIRILGISGGDNSTRSENTNIVIDGKKANYSYKIVNSSIAQRKTLIYEVQGLPYSTHDVEIYNSTQGVASNIDAIDIDKTGELIDKSIALKSSIDLIEGDTQQLIATTTPAGVQVTWTSSDSSIATVDENGNVTAKGEGTCTITTTINDGSGLTATCAVTVTKKDNPQPNQPSGDANLLIELVDGQIKQYTVSQDEINKFTSWFENRDKDHSLTATYKFTKGTYKDYVVHDQIDWFEVR